MSRNIDPPLLILRTSSPHDIPRYSARLIPLQHYEVGIESWNNNITHPCTYHFSLPFIPLLNMGLTNIAQEIPIFGGYASKSKD